MIINQTTSRKVYNFTITCFNPTLDPNTALSTDEDVLNEAYRLNGKYIVEKMSVHLKEVTSLTFRYT